MAKAAKPKRKRPLYRELKASYDRMTDESIKQRDKIFKLECEQLQAKQDVQALERLTEGKAHNLTAIREERKTFIDGFNEVSGHVPVNTLSDALESVGDLLDAQRRAGTTASTLMKEKRDFLDWASCRYTATLEPPVFDPYNARKAMFDTFEGVQKSLEKDMEDRQTNLNASVVETIEVRTELQSVKEAAATLLGSFAPKGGHIQC